MISQWTLAKFKSVYDETSLEMSPLVVFAGTNNSGKSTVLQSILLTAQSLQSPVSNRPITLNGHLVRLGTFDDILSTGSPEKKIEIGFSLSELASQTQRFPADYETVSIGPFWRRGGENIDRISCAFQFSPSGSGERHEILQLQPSVDACRVDVEYRDEDSDIEKTDSVAVVRGAEDVKARLDSLQLKQIRPDDLRALEYLVVQQGNAAQRPYYSFRSPNEVIGAVMFHFLPRALVARYDEVDENSKALIGAFTTPYEHAFYRTPDDVARKIPDEFRTKILSICEAIIGDGERGVRQLALRRAQAAYETLKSVFSIHHFRLFLTSLPSAERTNLVKKITDEATKLEHIIKGGRTSDFRTRLVPLSDESEFAHSYLVEYFQRYVRYLAPLRDEPKPVYPLAGMNDPTDVGLKGQHTAAVFETNKYRPVKFIPPEAFSSPLDSASGKMEPLQDAVLAWMRYMGVVTNVDSTDRGKLGHELRVSTEQLDQMRDLTHVGVGVSQVLPIVVLALLAPAGSTLIFEQPELHLHPRVQSRLADFFLSMTLLSKQCIVETHSEHIISRLRQRVATAASDQFAQKITIYFVEALGGKSLYKKIKINHYGSISEWPRGFFDEGEELAAAILKASLEKRSLR